MSDYGKDDWPRPSSTGREEAELRKALAYGEITNVEYKVVYRELQAQGKITRDGRQISEVT